MAVRLGKRSMFDADFREELLARIHNLKPDSIRLWGKMNAPQMVAHLTDQMGHTLGDVPTKPVMGLLRLAPVRYLSIYRVPWPKGKARGPVEAFVTKPGDWASDVSRLESLLKRFAERNPGGEWPQHALFGKMRGQDWGVFCYKHFDHHLRQFGC